MGPRCHRPPEQRARVSSPQPRPLQPHERIDARTLNVRQRHDDLTPERPQHVEAMDSHDEPLAV